MDRRFDVIIIGGGPGGYTAALRCARQGLSVALIEKEHLGGTCLNHGCIPSKVLLSSASLLEKIRLAGHLGIVAGAARPDWDSIRARKNAIVESFRQGLAGLLKGQEITIFPGHGVVLAPGRVRIGSGSGQAEISGDHIILATGSHPAPLSGICVDGKNILTSREIFDLPDIPDTIAIIGGGAIGCEMACIFSSFGSAVTLIEAQDSILPGEDDWIGRYLTRALKSRGVRVLSGTKVSEAENKALVRLNLTDGSTIETAKVLVAGGRRPVCDQESIESLGLEMRGTAIRVDRAMRTSCRNVYALGDTVGTTYLAHGAYAEAEIASANILKTGLAEMADYRLIPRTVHTFPQIASVGRRERDCLEEGFDFHVGKAYFKTNGQAVARHESSGEIRVIRDNATGKILGVSMIGDNVTEQITLARMMLGTTEDVARISFPHPTFSETLKESWDDALRQGLLLAKP